MSDDDYEAGLILLGAEVDALRASLEHDAYRGHCWNCTGCAASAVLAEVISDLLAGVPLVTMLTTVMQSYRKHEAERQSASDEQQRREREEYNEAARRHELAVTVACPYCGAKPGDTCRTVSAQRHPKGVHDHRDRYRLAAGILSPPKSSEG